MDLHRDGLRCSRLAQADQDQASAAAGLGVDYFFANPDTDFAPIIEGYTYAPLKVGYASLAYDFTPSCNRPKHYQYPIFKLALCRCFCAVWL
tara:strand:- start:72 stop:347 length:276 start_codon:yes stop_codon:yes gene_type:complete